jgi:enamine deaminase RidA (YjgF/YER057c/UK114 family)
MLVEFGIKSAMASPASDPHNHSARTGDLLFRPRRVPLEPSTRNIITGDINAQMAHAPGDIVALLQDQNAIFTHVVKITTFPTNPGNSRR